MQTYPFFECVLFLDVVRWHFIWIILLTYPSLNSSITHKRRHESCPSPAFSITYGEHNIKTSAVESHNTGSVCKCSGKMSCHQGWWEIFWMPTLWGVDSAARIRAVSQQQLHSRGKSFEVMRIFFIAYPGQIDGLCCGHSLLSVYNIAFALHCSDPVTPKGNWFLPLRCPFTSLSSLVFLFSLIPYLFFPFSHHHPPSPAALSSLCTFFFFTHTHTHNGIFMILLCLRPSFHSLFCPPPSLWLSCHACLFYCFIQYLKAPS